MTGPAARPRRSSARLRGASTVLATEASGTGSTGGRTRAGRGANAAATKRRRKASDTDTGGQNAQAESITHKNACDSGDDAGTSGGETLGLPVGYFEAHRSTAIRTSSDTLENVRLPGRRQLVDAIDALATRQHELDAEKVWRATSLARYMRFLAAGNSLLFFGFGSKRHVVERIVQALADDYVDCAVFIAQGYNPGLSLRALLKTVCEEIGVKDQPGSRRSLHSYVEAIRAHVEARATSGEGPGRGEPSVVVGIHNIDGPSLRNGEAQDVLSSLATVDGLHVVASVDHINAALLWDGVHVSRFRWASVRVDTYAPYADEVTYSARPLLQSAERNRVQAAIALLKSLSMNAQKVFRLLSTLQTGDDGGTTNGRAEDQPASLAGKASTRRHITFLDFYDRCRADFLVSDPSNLKVILTELETHELLDRKRVADSLEQICIPLPDEQLREVIDSLEPA